MHPRLEAIKDAVENLADACRPTLRLYRVRYLKKEPHPTQPNMVQGVWTTERVWDYGKEAAAKQVNPRLRYGRNCYVTKVMLGEIDYEEEPVDAD